MLTTSLRRHAGQLRPRRYVSRRFASTSPESTPAPSSYFRYFRTFSALTTVAVGSYLYGSLNPPTLATYISPRTAPPPLRADDPKHIAYVAGLEETLQSLPLLTAHRAKEGYGEWYEARPYLKVPEEERVNTLTGGALHGPGKLAIPSLVRSKRDNSEAMVFVHVGRALCGHEGIIHGGLLATLLDETLGRQASARRHPYRALLNLPEKIGVTAYLHLNYRAPTRADQFIVIKTRLIEISGRKAKVAGVIEDMQGTVLAEAEALFIQPKYAKLLDSKRLRELMGEPDDMQEPVKVPLPMQGGAPSLGDVKA
ncbi:uncharacterized protein FIBRA_07535 [Fibroporia radiculosa]|uniref:Thioesterase domain-containing protein n=1 Tax=Fibroporia radiculosa TaxID=599839 RepID=J4IBV5_9APHY|nr:uncharacterized protein FIBRA_07535 [Fibroporia radiculosa]CCM05321.1 predicted protein [Fibroporia radiculosa]